MYKGEPELDFFKHVPTVWDDTTVLQGQIGEYATIARRSGDEWFVGTMNAVQRRQLDIPLTFLGLGKKYTAHIYSDAKPDGNDRLGVASTQARCRLDHDARRRPGPQRRPRDPAGPGRMTPADSQI